MKIYKCKKCGNLVLTLNDKNSITCCGEEMKELVANTEDAASEKHVPVVSINNNEVTVKCGEMPHPMEEKHYIEFICIETTKGIQIHYLKPNNQPETSFTLIEGEELLSAYAYCNLHGLWKK
ncbi:MAG: desulfoferrodoxin Dfx [Bacilli bacterium]|nr:desulfoferrodoxin Dfx [Bacilli bacterium]